MMGDLLLVDFKAESKKYSRVPERTLEQMACELMDVVWHPNDQAVYESSLGFIAPKNDPA